MNCKSSFKWQQLDRSSILYEYFAYLYYDGDDVMLNEAQVSSLLREFIEQVLKEGWLIETFDVTTTFKLLQPNAKGQYSLKNLLEELFLLLH
ncbi:hypothetical protein THRCLA_23227 [Thraustotheca clavata]|uniref:Uncharacterized protein n=1 Tax=Thraustotheca clavata TaxID=74557 RepID=A0A1V9Y977_9STRA|nr:hypothetical protein THRCLA_23227 [Thraustotheca clavata]